MIDFLEDWHQHDWERKEMTKVVKELSNKGYSIHLCSNAEIYPIVLEENGLKAKDYLFIDNLTKNIQPTEAFGIDGYLYNGNELMFKEFLTNLKIL